MNAPRSSSEDTRIALLDAAFEEIHRNGFRGASLDNILARTGVTKGALYHHFPNKNALGYAVVDEVIVPWAAERWATLMDESLDPIDAIQHIYDDKIVRDQVVDPTLGCPINNLVEEMAGLDEGFRGRLTNIMETWQRTIAAALRRGQTKGQIRADVKPDDVATFLIAAYQGTVGVSKCMRDPAIIGACTRSLGHFLETLRVRGDQGTAAA